MTGAGQEVGLGVRVAGEHGGQPEVPAGEDGEGLPSEGVIEPEVTVLVAQVERTAAGIEQRHGAQQHALGQLLQIEGRRDRQPHVVEGLELDSPVVVGEPLLLQAASQSVDLERRHQRHQKGAARRPIARPHGEEPGAWKSDPLGGVARQALGEGARAAGQGALESGVRGDIERGRRGPLFSPPRFEQPLRQDAVAVLLVGQLGQLGPVVAAARVAHVSRPARGRPLPRSRRSSRTASGP